MSVVKRLTRNFVSLFVGNVAGQGLYFVALLHLSRILGPSEFGLWNFASAWMLYFLRGGEFGLEVVGLRRIARHTWDVGTTIGGIVTTRAFLAILLFLAVILMELYGLFPESASGLTLLFCVALFPMALNTEWVFEAHQKVIPVSLGRLTKGVLFFLTIFFFVSTPNDLWLAAVFYILSIAVPTVMLFFRAVRDFGWTLRESGIQRSVALLKESMPIGIATICLNYSIFAGTLFAGYMVTGPELGYYTAGHRIVVFGWAYVIFSLHRVLLPTLTVYFHERMDGYASFITRSFGLLVILSILLGIVGTFASDAIVSVLYSDAYKQAAPILVLLIWSFSIALCRSVLEIGLIASDQHNRYSKGVVIVAVAYTVFTPLLIYHMGVNGAALASVIIEISYLVALLLTFGHVKAPQFGSMLWKPLLAGFIAMVPVLFFVSEGRIWFVPLVCIIFLLLLAAIRGITSKDYALVRSIFEKRSADANA